MRCFWPLSPWLRSAAAGTRPRPASWRLGPASEHNSWTLPQVGVQMCSSRSTQQEFKKQVWDCRLSLSHAARCARCLFLKTTHTRSPARHCRWCTGQLPNAVALLEAAQAALHYGEPSIGTLLATAQELLSLLKLGAIDAGASSVQGR